MSPHHTRELTTGQIDQVRELAEAVEAGDGIAAFDEDTLLTLDRAGRSRYLVTASDDGTHHVGQPPLVGFAQVSEGSAEIAVHPDWRRRGWGTALVRAVLAEEPQARLWAHGNLPGAQAIASAHGLAIVRELWRMTRPAPRAADQAPPQVPSELSVRTFEVGADEQAWLAVNARAFADHPEQGRTTLEDLRARQEQDWFDPETFWLAEDAATGELLGSMWVKVTSSDGARSGEIYVLGVDPAAQGRSVGTVLTDVAMDYFANAGLDLLELYVESDNTAAIRTYRRVGFEIDVVHVQYAATTTHANRVNGTMAP